MATTSRLRSKGAAAANGGCARWWTRRPRWRSLWMRRGCSYTQYCLITESIAERQMGPAGGESALSTAAWLQRHPQRSPRRFSVLAHSRQQHTCPVSPWTMVAFRGSTMQITQTSSAEAVPARGGLAGGASSFMMPLSCTSLAVASSSSRRLMMSRIAAASAVGGGGRGGRGGTGGACDSAGSGVSPVTQKTCSSVLIRGGRLSAAPASTTTSKRALS